MLHTKLLKCRKLTCIFFCRQHVDSGGTFAVSQASASRDDNVRHQPGIFRPSLLSSQPAHHGRQIRQADVAFR